MNGWSRRLLEAGPSRCAVEEEPRQSCREQIDRRRRLVDDLAMRGEDDLRGAVADVERRPPRRADTLDAVVCPLGRRQRPDLAGRGDQIAREGDAVAADLREEADGTDRMARRRQHLDLEVAEPDRPVLREDAGDLDRPERAPLSWRTL